MKRIEVRNFITIKEAIYEPKKFNIIIGPQATGKSLLVKLNYFFETYLQNLILYPLENNALIHTEAKNLFYKFFNKKIVKDYNFSIKYTFKNIEIEIKNFNKTIEVNIDQNLKDLINDRIYVESLNLQEDLTTYLKKINPNTPFIKHITFIPAGRTYFATLQKSIFNLIRQGISIDPFLIEFGSQYENAKEFYEWSPIYNKKVSKIIRGDIIYSKEEQSFGVLKDEVFTKLSLLSSGQQEVLPLLIVLFNSMNQDNSLIIEEPEAHLYPTSQKELIELIAYAYNQGSEISITTHSPYIITAINNLLLLDEKKDKINKDNPLYKKLDFKISSNDISAYTIEDGILKNIYDKENNLIDAYTIDLVSEELSQEFDELLEL